jgi:hypothetical protein
MSAADPWSVFGDEDDAPAPSVSPAVVAAASAAAFDRARTQSMVSALSAFCRQHAPTIAADLSESKGADADVGARVASDVAAIARALPELEAALRRRADGGADAAAAASAAAQWHAVGSAASRAHDAALTRLRAPGGWPSVAWREAFVLALLCASARALCANGDARAAMRAADTALIMGAPRRAVAALLDPAEAAARRAAPPRAPLGLVPAVLEAGAALDLPLAGESGTAPRFRARAVPRRAAVAGPRADAGAGGGGAAEHATLRALRAPDDGGAPPADAASVRALLAASTPAVLCGAVRGWPALRKWRDLDWWARAVGHRFVPVEIGQHLGRGGWHEEALELADFMRDYVGASAREWGGGAAAARAPVAYLAQHGLFEQIPSLGADFSAPAVLDAAAIGSTNAWVGTAGTVTRAHFDSYDNVLCQVVGYKFVRVFAPADGPFLYPLAKTGAGAEAAQGNVSAVDVEAPDADAHPLFARATPFDAVLGPGDALVIPRGWWHYVRALTASASVNFWT